MPRQAAVISEARHGPSGGCGAGPGVPPGVRQGRPGAPWPPWPPAGHGAPRRGRRPRGPRRTSVPAHPGARSRAPGRSPPVPGRVPWPSPCPSPTWRVTLGQSRTPWGAPCRSSTGSGRGGWLGRGAVPHSYEGSGWTVRTSGDTGPLGGLVGPPPPTSGPQMAPGSVRCTRTRSPGGPFVRVGNPAPAELVGGRRPRGPPRPAGVGRPLVRGVQADRSYERPRHPPVGHPR